MPSKSANIEDLRKSIDEIDKEIVILFEKRAAAVFSIGQYKREQQLPVQDLSRELIIKKNVESLVSPSGPLSPREMSHLFMGLVAQFRFLESAHMLREMTFSQNNAVRLDFRKSQKVILWGFDLLSASFYLALNQALPHWSFRVVDQHLNSERFNNWKKEQSLNKIDLNNIELDNTSPMHQANLYVLGAPLAAHAKNLAEFAFPTEALILELANTKNIMDKTFSHRHGQSPISFLDVGAPPLGNGELSAFEHGDPLLFYNKTFFWVEPTSQSIEAATKVTFDTIATCLGAKSLWITAEDHGAALPKLTQRLSQLRNDIGAFEECEKLLVNLIFFCKKFKKKFKRGA